MIIARIAVYAAVLCTLWFNGSYAWSQATTLPYKLGLVALALTIDLCKCTFLAAAATCWNTRLRLRAAILVLLWPLALAYSTFCGYASILANRASAAIDTTAQVEERARAQRAYDETNAALGIAMASPLWQASAACNAPKTAQRAFCDKVALLPDQRRAAEEVLTRIPPRHAQPELTALANLTRVPLDTLVLIAAFWPAVLLELAASLGFYAVAGQTPLRPPKARSQAVSVEPALAPRRDVKTSGDDGQVMSRPVPPAQQSSASPKIRWSLADPP